MVIAIYCKLQAPISSLLSLRSHLQALIYSLQSLFFFIIGRESCEWFLTVASQPKISLRFAPYYIASQYVFGFAKASQNKFCSLYIYKFFLFHYRATLLASLVDMFHFVKSSLRKQVSFAPNVLAHLLILRRFARSVRELRSLNPGASPLNSAAKVVNSAKKTAF